MTAQKHAGVICQQSLNDDRTRWCRTTKISVETSSVPNGNETFSNLLRTRKCFTTSHMHIYSILPMSRMNCRQKIVPKVVVFRFYQRFRNDFFWKRQQVIKLSELKHCFKWSNQRKIDVNNFELCQSMYTWVENGLCTAVGGRDPGRWMFWSTSEASVSTVRPLHNFFKTLFHKIHDSYHN